MAKALERGPRPLSRVTKWSNSELSPRCCIARAWFCHTDAARLRDEWSKERLVKLRVCHISPAEVIVIVIVFPSIRLNVQPFKCTVD